MRLKCLYEKHGAHNHRHRQRERKRETYIHKYIHREPTRQRRRCLAIIIARWYCIQALLRSLLLHLLEISSIICIRMYICCLLLYELLLSWIKHHSVGIDLRRHVRLWRWDLLWTSEPRIRWAIRIGRWCTCAERILWCHRRAIRAGWTRWPRRWCWSTTDTGRVRSSCRWQSLRNDVLPRPSASARISTLLIRDLRLLLLLVRRWTSHLPVGIHTCRIHWCSWWIDAVQTCWIFKRRRKMLSQTTGLCVRTCVISWIVIGSGSWHHLTTWWSAGWNHDVLWGTNTACLDDALSIDRTKERNLRHLHGWLSRFYIDPKNRRQRVTPGGDVSIEKLTLSHVVWWIVPKWWVRIHHRGSTYSLLLLLLLRHIRLFCSLYRDHS